MSDKLKKTEVLYVPGNPDGTQKCGNCTAYIKDTKRCLLHLPTIIVAPKEVDDKTYVPVCGYFSYGNPLKKGEPRGTLTAEQSGLVWVKKPGTKCASCEYFEKPGACSKVEGDIDPMGCCAAWENHKRTLNDSESSV